MGFLSSTMCHRPHILVSSHRHRTQQVQHYWPPLKGGNRVPGRSCIRGGGSLQTQVCLTPLCSSLRPRPPPAHHSGGTVSMTARRLGVTLRAGVLAEVQSEHFGRILQPALTSGTAEIWKEALAHLHMTLWLCPAFATTVLSTVPLHLPEPAPAL